MSAPTAGRRPGWRLVAAIGAAVTVVAGCSDDNGGAIQSDGTAPLRPGATLAPSPYSPGDDGGAGLRLRAGLSGSSEVGGTGHPTAAGSATVTLEQVGRSCAVLELQGLDELTGAHIHRGRAGEAGPVVVDFGIRGTARQGCGDATAELVRDITADPSGFYVNVHTAEHPDGAVRGQLARES